MNRNASPENNGEKDSGATRQDRRAKKLRRKKDRMKVHGKSLGKIYENSVRKRTGDVDK